MDVGKVIAEQEWMDVAPILWIILGTGIIVTVVDIPYNIDMPSYNNWQP